MGGAGHRSGTLLARRRSPTSCLFFRFARRPFTTQNRLNSPSSPCPLQPQATPPPTLPLPAIPRCLPPPPPCPAFEYFNRYFLHTTPSAAPSSIPNTLLKSCRLPILDTSSLPPLIVKRPVLLPFCWPPTMATHSPIIISYL
jgi:hypothetical protein